MRILVLFVLVIAACAPRDRADLLPAPLPDTVIQPVYVGTTRGLPRAGAETDLPGGSRDTLLRFGRYDVAIPPGHRPGQTRRAGTPEAFDPQRHFSLAAAQAQDSSAFRADLRAAVGRTDPAGREVVVFVHGFNTTFIEGVYRVAQLRHDLNLPGVVVHYSWPSAGVPLAYAHDRDSALFARDGLEDLLSEIEAAGARRILLVGHSMGAHLLMETLRQMAVGRNRVMHSLSGVILISPDLDVDLFHAQARRIGTLPHPFVIVTSQRDRILRLSARLTGQRDRLGTLASAEPLADLPVTLFDVSAFSTGEGHFTVAQSPSLIALLAQLGAVDAALHMDEAGQLPLLPATVLTIQNATQVILQPAARLPGR